jgi:hypothetical protein
MVLNWCELKDKKVHLILKNNYEYNGTIISVDDRGTGLIFIEMLDKFNKKIIFTSGELKFIEVKE